MSSQDDILDVVVVGAGKATAPMALALEKILGDRLDGGLIVVKYGHVEELERIETVEADHPVPDENGRMAAQKMLDLAAESDAATLVISLISGGGSALLPLPSRCMVDGEEIVVSHQSSSSASAAAHSSRTSGRMSIPLVSSPSVSSV